MFIFSGKPIENQGIAGQGNCLLVEAFGLAAINCFHQKLGYICESKGNYLKKYKCILNYLRLETKRYS